MKRIIINTLALLSLSVLAAGCIEETFPQGSTQTQSQVMGSDAGLEALVNAIPSSMMMANVANHYSRYSDQLDFGIVSIHMRTDHMLDDIAIMADNPGYDWAVGYMQNQSMGTDNVLPSYFWDCYYPWIKMANDVLTAIDAENATQSQLGYLAQALTYRAMFYLDLARLYEFKENKYTTASDKILGLTVPIVKETTTEEEAMNNPRAPREELYEFILTDLQNAEKYFGSTPFAYNKPNLAAVYGLMARTYLEMGYWKDGGDSEAFAQAAEYARKAISTSGCTPLTEAQWTDPANGFNDGSASNSWIWGLPITIAQVGNLIAWVAHLSMEAQWGYGSLSHIGISALTYSKITQGDFRKQSWLDPDWEGFGGSYKFDYKFSGTEADQEVYKSKARPCESIKFRPAEGNCTVWQTGNLGEGVLMRVEEMYFIEMEAVAHSNLAEAENLLNTYMNTYRMSSGTYSCATKVDDLDTFLEEMLLQKRIEFWGEGILIYDYKRLDHGITRGYSGTNIPATFCYNTEGRSPQWNIVISRLETQANMGITDATNNPDPSGQIPLWTGQ